MKKICFFISIVCFFQCKHDAGLLGEDSGNFALVISYDKEMISHQNNSQITDTSLLSFSDKMKETPQISREYWEIKVRKNGTCRMEMTQRTPTISFGETPSLARDMNAEIHKIIYDNNEAYVFNNSNRLMYTFPFECPDMTDVLERYQGVCADTYTASNEVLKSRMIPASHIQVTDNQFYSESMGKLTERVFYDTVAQVLVKSELYDSVFTMIGKDTVAYEELAPGHFVPIFEAYTSYLVNTFGQAYTHESFTTYLDVTVVSNE